MKRWHLVVAVTTALLSTQSYALFDAQVLYGQRTGSFENSGTTNTLKGKEMKAAFHLSPIPLIPIGFGLSVSNVTYEDTTKMPFKDFQGMEGSAEVMAWIPIPGFDITPYAKLGYVVYGVYGFDTTGPDPAAPTTTTDYKSVFKPKGTDIALGIKYSPLPLIGILLEYDMRTLTLEADEMKVGATKVATTGADYDNKNSTVLLGVQVGI